VTAEIKRFPSEIERGMLEKANRTFYKIAYDDTAEFEDDKRAAP